MLSENIRSLHDRMQSHQAGGIFLHPKAVDTLCLLLSSFAEDAERLEGATIPQHLRLDHADLPDNVVKFSRKNGGNVVPLHIPAGSDGDGAA